MRIAVFVIPLLVALGYAAWKGGAPERAMAIIATLLVLIDWLFLGNSVAVYQTVDWAHLILDLFGASATIVLALVAHRFWPMIAAVLLSLPFLGHISRILDVSMDPIAYLTMQVASSWLLPPLLILGTWRHQQRLRRNGSDPSWFISWRQSTPPTASD